MEGWHWGTLTHPKTNISSWKLMFGRWIFLLKWSLFKIFVWVLSECPLPRRVPRCQQIDLPGIFSTNTGEWPSSLYKEGDIHDFYRYIHIHMNKHTHHIYIFTWIYNHTFTIWLLTHYCRHQVRTCNMLALWNSNDLFLIKKKHVLFIEARTLDREFMYFFNKYLAKL